MRVRVRCGAVWRGAVCGVWTELNCGGVSSLQVVDFYALFASSELRTSSSYLSLCPSLIIPLSAPCPLLSRVTSCRVGLTQFFLRVFFLFHFIFCLVLFSFFVVFVKNLRSVNEALKRAFNKFT